MSVGRRSVVGAADMGLCVTRALLFVLALMAVTGANAKSSISSRHSKKFTVFTQHDRESCKNGQISSGQRVDTSDRLRRLRLRMKASSYDAYIVPSNDEHQSEFIANHDKRREFISGFSGSAGIAVVLQSSAALWTDGRYFLQAEQELDCNWILMKERQKNTPTVSEWLSRNLMPGTQIGADPKLMKYKEFLNFKEKIKSYDMDLIESRGNLIDDIWSIAQGRTPESISHIIIHDIKYAGKSYQEKIEELRNFLKENDVNGIVITALDEISWLFNMRSNDVPHTPVFKAYAFVSQDHIRLYVNPLKLTEEVRRFLNSKNCNSSDCVVIKNYDEAFQDIKELSSSIPGKIMLSSHSSYGIVSIIPEEQRKIQDGPSPISILRSVKNAVEIKGMKNANLKDAVAIADFIALLDKEVSGGKQWDEIKAAKVLSKFRAQQAFYMDDSFSAISASGSNGAVIHYIPKPSTNKNITTDEMFLLDSGAQYLDGTTDITRTFHFGEPTDFQKEAYTRVLMGSINLMTTIFPEGTKDVALDILARKPLYDAGLDYLHGTGHGIGTFLAVHEEPIKIGSSAFKTGGGYALKPGMFMSDEPGYYQDGEFGIRLETVMMVVKANTPYRFNDLDYYTFEPITLLPFEPKLIKTQILTKKQKEWLNDYNAKVRNSVGVELRRQKRENGFKWLLSKTEHIPVYNCMSASAQDWTPSYSVMLFSLALTCVIL